jgi:endonuclease YncB( thermonuclease family)
MSTPYDTNVYKATILKHHDGDTTWAEVALGFDVSMRLTVRWSGIDAPELGTAVGVGHGPILDQSIRIYIWCSNI